MIILADEDTPWHELLHQLNRIGSQYGCTFAPFPRQYKSRSIPDEEVPGICRSEGAAALLTINYKDFARHLLYYQALMDVGISAIVLRQPNQNTEIADVGYQVSLLKPRLRNIVRRLSQETDALLFVVNKSGVRTNRLEDLIARFPS